VQIYDKAMKTGAHMFQPPFQGIAWIVGYIAGDFTLTFYGWSVGLVLSLMVS
jgi:hypothetical protein